MDKDAYLEGAIKDVLSGDDAALDDRIAHAALLFAVSGAMAEADRLITHWHALTERPVTALVPGAVRARAWAMLFEARGARPEWAAALTPLDLDAEERAHEDYLARRASDLDGLLGGSPIGEAVAHLGPSRPDRLREAVARGDLDAWADIASRQARPDVAVLAATRRLAPRLVAGADPLGLGEWPEVCAGALVAALYERHPPDTGSWREMIAGILRLRGGGTAPPAASLRTIGAAEARLGLRLPDDYREFLQTCDGLPADVVFPRLLGTAELRAEGGVVVIAEPAVVLLTAAGDEWRTVEIDPALGTTVHPTFRALLERHLLLLAQSA
ncbi:SMI1/KNR4 family protein [Amycolatopsis sp. WAC 04182]|uniref:SMI1/KNR4 family protein n=1 Tax=Amycolatopsis sp. WAC 04182 TaxID=2203198 RepID=UPI000F7AC367|nr:SMI1/KNR4 family protein [Amycolatopsis sp. WAC 04182]RSN53105.1 SMI1/KNR4 family protein [Amycolatopsis sp. WAC 04182]